MKTNSKIVDVLFSSLIFFTLLPGCTVKYEKVEQEIKNPTSYCFDYSLDELKSAIIYVFDSAKYRNHPLRFRESPFFYENNKYFSSEDNYNDAILECNNAPSDEKTSFIYYKNGYPMEYYATFQLHVTESSQKKTCLEIFTIEPKIKIGVFFEFTHDLSFNNARYISVDPSTIEEYEILHLIGNRLGQKGMPKVQYPDSTAATKTKRYFSLVYPIDEK